MADIIIGSSNTLRSCNSVTLTGLELAKKDLENHFSIKKGEKWSNPEFGTNIPYYLFQPIDEFVAQSIRDEVIEVIDYDPRFELIDDNIEVTEDTYSVNVSVNVKYIPLNQVETIYIEFQREQTETDNL
jgi:phage baseplate assembly protein W